jgi:hypothetical protein
MQEMDQNGDGNVTFKEMLKLIYRNASAEDLDVMWSWVRWGASRLFVRTRATARMLWEPIARAQG